MVCNCSDFTFIKGVTDIVKVAITNAMTILSLYFSHPRRATCPVVCICSGLSKIFVNDLQISDRRPSLMPPPSYWIGHPVKT